MNTKATQIKDKIEERNGKLRMFIWFIAAVLSLVAVFSGEPIFIFDHSAQFYTSFENKKPYWDAVLSNFGLNN